MGLGLGSCLASGAEEGFGVACACGGDVFGGGGAFGGGGGAPLEESTCVKPS